MKYSYFTSIFAFIIFTSFLSDQNDILEKIASSIKSGNTVELASHFDSNIKLTLSGLEEDISKQQAEKKLGAYFKAYPPNNYSILHKGKSQKDAQFSIGNYTVENKTFRVYTYLKLSNNNLVIKELKIEEQ